MELFVEHRIQGDVLFSLTEENLREMGVGKVGDRLLITDITQTLYEQITGWQQQTVKQNSPQLLQLSGVGFQRGYVNGPVLILDNVDSACILRDGLYIAVL